MEIKMENSKLCELAEVIGGGIKALNFQITLNDELVLDSKKFILTYSGNAETWTFEGSWRDIDIQWQFKKSTCGWLVGLTAVSILPLDIKSIKSLIADYCGDQQDIDEWFVPVSGDHVAHTGIIRVRELEEKKPEGKACGVYKKSQDKGVFIAAVYPLNNIVNHSVSKIDTGSLRFSAETKFTPGQAKSKMLHCESVWLCTTKNMCDAMNKYSDLLPSLKQHIEIPIGWNSWDYYFRTVTLQDMIENMDAIRKDSLLTDKIKYIVVDDGWSYYWGEWEPNHKFPGGMKHLAEEIKTRGFIPGIWTAPLQVDGLSLTAMRNSDILIKDEYGDPLDSDVGGHYMVDPTHPGGQKFIKELYKGLYNDGYRLFKVDFVNGLKNAKYFSKQEIGPYEAIRELFRIIRECVGPESHIVGCSLPEECGPGIADSGRIGIDIHNQWAHVEWVTDSILHNYWLQDKVWINDPDFLIVRGLETSLEKETNVMNPKANNPNTEGFAVRWRRGPVFSYDEARTWTNIVMLCGGSVFLSDRITMLNEKGLKLIYKALEPTGIAAKPLDLCEATRPTFWLQEIDESIRLGIINWRKEDTEVEFDFAQYELDIPQAVNDFWGEDKVQIKQGKFKVSLKAHESILFYWKKD